MAGVVTHPRREASGLTAGLAAEAATLELRDLPDDVVEIARQALLDWLGASVAGSREPAARLLLETLPRRDAQAPDTVTVIGHDFRLAARDAALANGTASHALDFDDVNLAFLGHASVAVLPAVLALAEREGASGAELLAAFVAGYETACRVAVAIGPEPYRRGFHHTGTVGTFGAAAACARLLALDPQRTATALGIAASEAAGLKCSFGTMTKPLHAGRACEAGLLAAELAARGFTAAPTAIEAERGFAALAGGGCDTAAALAPPPEGWHLRGNLFKYHAACWFTHSAIEGARELRSAHGVDAASVRRVVLHVSEVELGACAIAAPADGLQVKFSIAHLAAMALLGRDTTVIGDAAAADRDVLLLRERVVLAEDGSAGAPTRVTIELDEGSVVEAAVDVDAPVRDLAAQRLRLERKFRALAEPVLGAAGADRLRERAGAVEQTGVRELMTAAVPAQASPGASVPAGAPRGGRPQAGPDRARA